jgi:PAS domain-containing protein
VNQVKKELGEGLRLILESIADGVIIVDDKKQVVLLNQAAERITGWSAKEAIKQYWIAVFNVMERDQKQPLEYLLHDVILYFTHSAISFPSIFFGLTQSKLKANQLKPLL